MIRSEHCIVEYDFTRFIVAPDRLRRVSDARYVDAAAMMLRIYRDGIGQRRQTLHRAVESCLTRLGNCPPRRVAAFCKLLDDLSEFSSGRPTAFALRQQVFELGSALHPLVDQREGVFENERTAARLEVARAIGKPWKEIEAELFSDVLELQSLLSFSEDWSPERLLARYNTAQTQAALFRATRVRVDATADFKTILRHAKLSGLMHRIYPMRIKGVDGYRFVFDGPQSSLRETTRYGVRFAAMIPKLLTCLHWQLTAEVLGPRRQSFRLSLSPDDGLKSTLERESKFDSLLESEIDALWRRHPIEGWTWTRESKLLVHGQMVMTPDFVLFHCARKITVYIEVVGYWTPEYLTEKGARLRHFINERPKHNSPDTNVKWLLILPSKATAEQRRLLSQLPIPAVAFDKKATPAIWLQALGLEF